jgi:hypothetical protein
MVVGEMLKLGETPADTRDVIPTGRAASTNAKRGFARQRNQIHVAAPGAPKIRQPFLIYASDK